MLFRSPAHEVLRGLENGEIDLAIGLFPELEKHRFFKQRLLVYRPVCLMRADHPFKGDSLSLKQYLGLGHVEVDPGPRTGPFWRQMFRQEKMNRRIETIPSQAMEVFCSYAWPGNIRELENFIERAVILSPGSVLRPPLAEDRKSTRLNSSHSGESRMPSSA